MAGVWNISSWSLTFFLVTYVCVCWGCTPPDGKYVAPAVEEKVYYSDIVVYGNVIDIKRGQDAGYMYDTMSTVVFEVFCIIKGKVLPQTIEITRAGTNVSPGYEPGLCISTNFTKGMPYLVFLNDDLTPRYSEDNDENGQLMDDIPIYCEVTLSYPLGLDVDSAKYECPEPYVDYDECIEFVPTTPAPETTAEPGSVVVKTMPPKDGDKDTSKDGNMAADGTPEGADSEPGQAVSLEDGKGSGANVVISLALTALCLLISLF